MKCLLAVVGDMLGLVLRGIFWTGKWWG